MTYQTNKSNVISQGRSVEIKSDEQENKFANILIWHFIWGGHVHLLFLNGQPTVFASHTEVIFMLVGVSAGLFTASFLEVRRYAPKTAYAVYAFILIQIAVGAISAFDLVSSGAKNSVVYGVAVSAIFCYIAAGFEAHK